MRGLFAGALMAAASASVMLTSGPADAQDASARPVRIVVPFTAGGFPDRLARVVAKHLSDELNQRVYVENRPGAGGLVGSADVARSAPDGTTLFISSVASQIIAPLLNPQSGLDTLKDFTHIAYIGGPPIGLVTSTSGKLRTFDDVLKASQRSAVSYGTAGVGTAGHLAAEFVAKKTGLKSIHVPYNGPMLGDIISGVVDLGSIGTSTAIGNVQGGKLWLIAVASRQRLPDFPDVPTFRDLGLDLDAVNWLALSGPAGLPEPLVLRLNGEVVRLMNQPEQRTMLRQEVIEPIAMSPAELAEFFRAELKRWEPVVASAGLRK
jgi:tripartite-type tricarboxylate transporter receptor subunit TctC